MNGTTARRVATTGAPDPIDLTDPGHLDWVRRSAEALEDSCDAVELKRQVALPEAPALPVATRLAYKLALSRHLLRKTRHPVHLSVVFAVYRENIRILPRDEHPHGEDFLRRKLEQLRWLFGPTPQHGWDLTVVDDGCPEGSGKLAEDVLNEAAGADEAGVLFLEEAIRDGLPVAAGMASTGDSQKGGAIRFGLWNAARQPRDAEHIALFTDADLSTHLSQAGLLIRPIAGEAEQSGARVQAAIGSRRERESVVVKEASRDARGRLFIYLWKRLLPQLGGIVDTQCGFKAFRVSHLRTWIEDTRENGFAFDIEYLLRVQLSDPGSIVRVPVAWIDSAAESTTTELEPYLPMLRAVVRLYRTHLPEESGAEGFARLIESLDDVAFRRLLDRVPDEIASREPREFDAYSAVSAEELGERAGV